jgi:hypothetical protein
MSVIKSSYLDKSSYPRQVGVEYAKLHAIYPTDEEAKALLNTILEVQGEIVRSFLKYVLARYKRLDFRNIIALYRKCMYGMDQHVRYNMIPQEWFWKEISNLLNKTQFESAFDVNKRIVTEHRKVYVFNCVPVKCDNEWIISFNVEELKPDIPNVNCIESFPVISEKRHVELWELSGNKKTTKEPEALENANAVDNKEKAKEEVKEDKPKEIKKEDIEKEQEEFIAEQERIENPIDNHMINMSPEFSKIHILDKFQLQEQIRYHYQLKAQLDANLVVLQQRLIEVLSRT